MCRRAPKPQDAALPSTCRAKATTKERPSERFIIEQGDPGAGDLTKRSARSRAPRTAAVASAQGTVPVRSRAPVTADKVYCVHEADDEETIRERATSSQAKLIPTCVDDEPQTADVARRQADHDAQPARRRHQQRHPRRHDERGHVPGPES